MNLREKYAAAQAARPWQLGADRAQMNYALMTFTQNIPQMMQTAIDRVSAGEIVDAKRDALFAQVAEITGGWRHYGDLRDKLKKFAELPAMQGLKAYLSDPAVDIAFTAHVSGRYAQGSYIETLRLAINPDQPFAASTINYADASKSEKLEMTENDKLAWTGGTKPKMAAPALKSPAKP
ncbi:MAG: hypothetical protein IT560_13280 [Alphaproteobacteria bacterium]|nr:hypothetical protein [Alphaproteobacteria bacterium]